MTSLLRSTKQIPANAGYYIPVGNCLSTFVQNNGTDAVPAFGQIISTLSTAGAGVSSLVNAAGAGVFRDMGKTLISSGRTFRKVQVLINTPDLASGSVTATSGVGGPSPTYITGYIQLPGSGDGANQSGGIFTPVARLG